ncbi:MAG: Sec-independent protein translocase subunit TatA/TatB [Planctomycetota bacterium]|jgi:sec-independent protein translocase protein TatA
MFHAPLIAGIPGGPEIWVILAIILLLFGRRIPQVARSLGQGISQFKRGLNEPDAPEDEKLPPPQKEENETDSSGSGSSGNGA